ncbi:MAG: prepilin-type N-terminal cleavage/methylation domain-containing protein [Myxococcales bacterium]|nr:prepilin-type N-terminal cleavage/methylation domain-containing protein [Myxococcales bacterium]MCB9522127.1 prepilin-type N-terminal cleavage/methylation domain-containing protein [Myxococcales bacterium]
MRATAHRLRPRARGFTLLEVMIAMAILVLALAALLGHEGVAIQMSDYSNKVSQATFLAQSKMLDVEHKILKESIDVLDNCEDGDFRDEGFRDYRWKACAYKIEITEGAGEQLTQRFIQLLSGFTGVDIANGGAEGMGGLERAVGQISMATGMIPAFLQQLEDQIRKVKLEITWKDMVGERTLVIERYVTQLGADAAGAPPPKDGEAQMGIDEAAKMQQGINPNQ